MWFLHKTSWVLLLLFCTRGEMLFHSYSSFSSTDRMQYRFNSCSLEAGSSSISSSSASKPATSRPKSVAGEKGGRIKSLRIHNTKRRVGTFKQHHVCIKRKASAPPRGPTGQRRRAEPSEPQPAPTCALSAAHGAAARQQPPSALTAARSGGLRRKGRGLGELSRPPPLRCVLLWRVLARGRSSWKREWGWGEFVPQGRAWFPDASLALLPRDGPSSPARCGPGLSSWLSSPAGRARAAKWRRGPSGRPRFEQCGRCCCGSTLITLKGRRLCCVFTKKIRRGEERPGSCGRRAGQFLASRARPVPFSSRESWACIEVLLWGRLAVSRRVTWLVRELQNDEIISKGNKVGRCIRSEI